VDVRILAATHRDLQEMAREQKFREDLLYRLDVVAIEIPALRHRREDILPLVEHFLKTFRDKYPASPVTGFSPAALGRLMDYPWPGNVRELAHLIQRAVVLGRGPVADLEDLPPALLQAPPAVPDGFAELVPARELQHRYAAWALERCGGHKSRTAEKLGIDIKTLNRWLQDGPEPDGDARGTR
jgi:two-component system response regulator HydG